MPPLGNRSRHIGRTLVSPRWLSAVGELIFEAAFRLWCLWERIVAWKLGRRQAKESVRYVWIHRREAADGVLGLHIKPHKPSKIMKAISLLAWYSPLGRIIVRWAQKDWEEGEA